MGKISELKQFYLNRFLENARTIVYDEYLPDQVKDENIVEIIIELKASIFDNQVYLTKGEEELVQDYDNLFVHKADIGLKEFRKRLMNSELSLELNKIVNEFSTSKSDQICEEFENPDEYNTQPWYPDLLG